MRITCWLTVLVTIERCVCLVSPLKVKTVFTTKTSITSAVLIFGFFLLNQTLNFLRKQLDLKFDKAENRSLIGVVPGNLFGPLKHVNSTINITLGFLSLCAILMSSFDLLYFLKRRRNAAWRIATSGPTVTWRGGVPGNRRPRRLCCPTKRTFTLNSPATADPRTSIELTSCRREPVTSRYLSPYAPSFRHPVRASPPATSLEWPPTSLNSVRDSENEIGSTTNVITTSTTMTAPTCNIAPARIPASATAIATSKDHRLCRMILLLSTIMILGFLPNAICLVLSIRYKEFRIGKSLNNSFVVAYSCTFVIEAINASVNIFFYYTMSSNYRHTLNKMFPWFKRMTRRVGDVHDQRAS